MSKATVCGLGPNQWLFDWMPELYLYFFNKGSIELTTFAPAGMLIWFPFSRGNSVILVIWAEVLDFTRTTLKGRVCIDKERPDLPYHCAHRVYS